MERTFRFTVTVWSNYKVVYSYERRVTVKHLRSTRKRCIKLAKKWMNSIGTEAVVNLDSKLYTRFQKFNDGITCSRERLTRLKRRQRERNQQTKTKTHF